MANHLRFLFDPLCPWAYRASLWIREAANARPLEIEWGLLSLEYINRDKMETAHLDLLRQNRWAMRLLARARQAGGNRAMGDLYLALGEARHERLQALDDPKILAGALEQAGLPAKLLEESRVDDDLDAKLEEAYARAVSLGAFGVPTLFLDKGSSPFYGPLIDVVPRDEEAGKLWDYVSGLMWMPYFYELKRNRRK
jgi:predicted DsbA family dithiol-disulfide isomerase